MIIATAGHIDHGKTALIRALTGVDTDRLPEEKARGISIDLGFAYLTLGDGTVLGFVDVPGHERFVRNMLAGVCGIDFVMLVVAADDGVMPQTLEHVAILQLLGIDRGVAVVSKTDVASAERIREVTSQVRALLAPTPLAGIPIREVSSVTGAGLATLRQDLEAAARMHASRWQKDGHFRLAIDRVFSVTGSGTVVTGTVFDGNVATGARCTLSPRGTTVRVRGLEMRGQAVDSVSAGSRCAINLAGVEVAEVTRGDWLVSPLNDAPTHRLDATLTLLASEARPLAHQTQVHLHLGTADVVARIVTRRGVAIGPGTTAHAQLVLERPVAAFVGDRFIVRDQAARRTLGGGVVIDPFPSTDRRASPQRDTVRQAMSLGDPRLTLAALMQIPDYAIDLNRFERAFNLTAERAAALYREASAATLGRDMRIAIPASNVRMLEERVLETLAGSNADKPGASGIGLDALRKDVAPYLPPEAFLFLVRELGFRHKIELANSIVRLSGSSGSFTPADEVLWQRVLPAMIEGGATPLPVEQLAVDLNVKETVLVDLLHRKRKSGLVAAATASRFYPRESLARLAASAAHVADASESGAFTAAQYRDALGTGRTLAIHILELFDQMGVTLRNGDLRRMNPGFAAIVGAGSPMPVAVPRPPAPATRTTSADRGAGRLR